MKKFQEKNTTNQFFHLLNQSTSLKTLMLSVNKCKATDIFLQSVTL